MRTITLSILLFLSCSGGDVGNIPVVNHSKVDTLHKTWCCINDTTHNKITVNDTTHNKITLTDTTHKKVTVNDTAYNHVRITDTTHKDSVVWNIVPKDTSLIIPLYIDKRLAPYLNDSLKIRFKITYTR